MVVGLILEANPYHNGHQYLVNKAKTLFKDATLIAVTSTSFTMRGEISLISKFEKTKTLLNEGIDLVLELPISSTLQSADYFAYNTVSTLHKLGVTNIVVGSEINDIKLLEYYYEFTSSNEFKKLFKDNLSLNLSYKATFEKTLKDLGMDEQKVKEFSYPNITLAYQYYKVIKDNNFNIELNLIERTNNFYQRVATSNIASATYIRSLVLNNKEYSNYLPYNYDIINLQEAHKALMSLINFQLLSWNLKDNILQINHNEEGICNYIINNNLNTNNYLTFLESLKNKRYSTSRVRRAILSMLLKLPKGYELEQNYLRLLGISSKGSNYLKQLPKNTKQLIFSTPKELSKFNDQHLQNILNFEIASTKLYGLISNNLDLYKEEYKLPIKKEGI